MPATRWQQLNPSGDLWQLGKTLVQDREGEFSYRNCRVLQSEDGAICAMVNSFQMFDDKLEEEPPWPPFADPIKKLEALCVDNYYINFIATFDVYKKQGCAARLIADVERRAKLIAVGKLNLIVLSSKKAALGLYERKGFTIIAQEHAVPMGTAFDGDDWLLMQKNVTGS